MRQLLRKIISKNKALILHEARDLNDFMDLLMKPRNTGVDWTREEIRQIKSHLKHLSLMVPALCIFMLPFGSLLLPILAEIMDRRRRTRRKETEGG